MKILRVGLFSENKINGYIELSEDYYNLHVATEFKKKIQKIEVQPLKRY